MAQRLKPGNQESLPPLASYLEKAESCGNMHEECIAVKTTDLVGQRRKKNGLSRAVLKWKQNRGLQKVICQMGLFST